MSDALINGLAGAGGGIIAQLITYPLQTVNTRRQTERDPFKSVARDGVVRQMLEVAKHERWERLFGGFAPSLVGTAASQGVYYYFYQIFRNRAETAAQDRWKKGIGYGAVGMFQSLVVAALSGCVNVLLTNPIWVVVTRMQTHKKMSNRSPNHSLSCILDEEVQLAAVEHRPYGTSHAVQELYNEAGLWGFWKGVIPTLIMIFLLGAIAKLGATVVTYPLLVVKARLQVKQGLNDDKRRQYTGTYDAISKMILYEGLACLYKGMGTKIVQRVFAAAVLFMVKEKLVKAAGKLITGELRLMTNSKLRPP